MRCNRGLPICWQPRLRFKTADSGLRQRSQQLPGAAWRQPDTQLSVLGEHCAQDILRLWPQPALQEH